MASRASYGKRRVCVVGLDGVPHPLLARLAAAGVMPAVKELCGAGRLRTMRASIPEISAVSWTSFATGSNPGVHGIFGFVDLKPDSYALRFPNFLDCRARTIWDEVGAAGGRSVVINQPFTYPARPLAGELISGFVALDLERGAHPPGLAARLKRAGYRIDIDTARCRADHGLLWRQLAETLAGRRRAVEMLWGGAWRYFQVVVTGTDRLHHYLWPAVEDRDHPHGEAALDYYRAVDRFVGEVWGRFRDLEGEGAAERFFLLSDHGFCRIEREVYLNRWLEEEGYLRYRGGASSIEELDGGSRAFCLDPGRIYLNLRGRFPRGSVEPAEAPGLAEEIGGKLRALEHGGAPVMRNVFARDEVYAGPAAACGPDLVALANRGFDLKGSTAAKAVFGSSDLTGMHTWDDAFVLTAAELQEPLFIWDLYGVILGLLGIEKGKNR